MKEEQIQEMLRRQSVYDLAGWRDYFKKSRSVLLVIDPQNDVLQEKGRLSFTGSWKHARDAGAFHAGPAWASSPDGLPYSS